jgi:hypothetical protein
MFYTANKVGNNITRISRTPLPTSLATSSPHPTKRNQDTLINEENRSQETEETQLFQ